MFVLFNTIFSETFAIGESQFIEAKSLQMPLIVLRRVYVARWVPSICKGKQKSDACRKDKSPIGMNSGGLMSDSVLHRLSKGFFITLIRNNSGNKSNMRWEKFDVPIMA